MRVQSIFLPRARSAMRVALSHYVLIGLSAAVGLFAISTAVHLLFGAVAAATAVIGVIVMVPPDQPAPRRGKLRQLLPSLVVALPLFVVVQALHDEPLALFVLIVPASFFAFLGAAWGKRGIPISMSAMFAIIFSIAVSPPEVASPHRWAAIATTASFFALGAVAYLLYATAANGVLNARYRVQLLADVLLAIATLMRTQARQFVPLAERQRAPVDPIGQLLRNQAALADQIQGARDLLLESPRTVRRQQLAAMLIALLEMRDHLLACELDLDRLVSHASPAAVLAAMRETLLALGQEVEALADQLLLGRKPRRFASHRPRLAGLRWPGEPASEVIDREMTALDAVATDWQGSRAVADGGDGRRGPRPALRSAAAQAAGGAPAAAATRETGPSAAILARGIADRIGHIDDEILRLIALARGDTAPDLAVVQATWKMFVSPTTWSWRPFLSLWHWDAPPLRHAIRAALAIATAYALAAALPWGTHPYWILLTITVVLRGSLAQTLERRNSRVVGTLLGSLVAGALLSLDAPAAVLLLMVTAAQGVAHAFAIKRYLVTAVAATVLALVQAHLLNAGVSPMFEAFERIADTVLGVAIAWAFSYVLPSWERTQIPVLVRRTLQAHARHARLALGLGQLGGTEHEPELEWRLARREAYDSLSALVQASQRSLSEPRAVRPPLEPLGRLLAHSYQLLAQLTAAKTTLLLRRPRLDAAKLAMPLVSAATTISATLGGGRTAPPDGGSAADRSTEPLALPDPFEHDLTPWLLRRLRLAEDLALEVCNDARIVLDLTASVGPCDAGEPDDAFSGKLPGVPAAPGTSKAAATTRASNA